MDLSDSDSSDPLSPYSPSDDSLQITSPEIQLPIECRNPPQWWWMVPIGLAAAVFFIVELPAESPELPAGQTNWPIIFLSGILGLFFGGVAIYLALELMFSSVRADERGLTSRRPFSGWKSTRWEEITDYYWAPRGDRVVITPVGKHRLDSSFRNVEQMADLVNAKTPHLANAGWERKDMRPSENWSRSFSPWSGMTKWTAPSFTLLLIVALILWIINPDPTPPIQISGVDIFPLILAIVFVGLFVGAIIFMLFFMWREWLLDYRHRDVKLTMNAQGITFTGPDRHFEATWPEIKQISVLPKAKGIAPVQLETADKMYILWPHEGSSSWTYLEHTLKQHVPHAFKTQEANDKQSEVQANDILGEKGAWSGGAIGVGARRWSFRTKRVRFALLTTSFLVLFAPILYLMQAYLKTIDEPLHIALPFIINWSLLNVLVVAALWLWYYRADILADEQGIELRSPFRPVYRVKWADIEAQEADSWGKFIRVGRKKRYFARLFQPIRIEELQAYIAQQLKK